MNVGIHVIIIYDVLVIQQITADLDFKVNAYALVRNKL